MEVRVFDPDSPQGPPIGGRVSSSARWAFLSQAWRQIVVLLTTIVVARLLDPSAAGLYAMAAVVANFLMQFKDLGTASALIHRSEVDEDLLSSVFWANVLTGVAAAVALVLTAKPISGFYREPDLVPVLTALALAFLFAGPGIVPQAIMEKNLRFKHVSIAESVAVTIGCITAVAVALAGGGVWSLVVQTVVTAGLTALAMFIAAGWRPLMRLQVSSLKGVASYGGDVVGFSLVNYWVRNADNLLVGRVLGTAALGPYALAYRLMLFPVHNIATVVGRVSFPALSLLREDRERVRRAYLRSLRVISLVTFPTMAAMSVLSRPFTLAVLGAKWEAVIVPLAVLAPVGLLQSVGSTVGPLFQSTGHTRVQLWWALLTAPVYIGAFVLGLQWGINGVAACYAVVSAVLFLPGMWLGGRTIDLHLGRVLRNLAPVTAATVLSAAAAWLAVAALESTGSYWLELGGGVLSAIAVYVGATAILNRGSFIELWGVFRTRPASEAVL